MDNAPFLIIKKCVKKLECVIKILNYHQTAKEPSIRRAVRNLQVLKLSWTKLSIPQANLYDTAGPTTGQDGTREEPNKRTRNKVRFKPACDKANRKRTRTLNRYYRAILFEPANGQALESIYLHSLTNLAAVENEFLISNLDSKMSANQKYYQNLIQQENQNSDENVIFTFSEGFFERLKHELRFKKAELIAKIHDDNEDAVDNGPYSEKYSEIAMVDFSRLSTEDQSMLATALYEIYRCDRSIKSLKFCGNRAIFIPGWPHIIVGQENQ